MGRRKKLDSQNIRNEKIKAVNNSENIAGEILMCDVDEAMLSERIPPPPTFHNTTHHHQAVVARLVHHGMTNFNTDTILEEYRLMVLHSILDSVTAVEQEWTRSVILTVQKRFERMHRNDIYVFKKLTQNEAEREISQKRIKSDVESPLLPSELIERKVLDLINRIIGEYADSYVPMMITDVAQIIQGAQVCFDEATQNHARVNLNLSSVTDLSEALVKKNGSLNIYEKKNYDNRMFEIFRDRFYRGLSERVESEHVVSRDEIVSFWSTMWNKNDDTVTYDDYLILFVSDNHPTTFPSLDEFVSIINWLPNWIAAGIDGFTIFLLRNYNSSQISL
ncbi:hypothetical protein CWI36_0196p0010 [Hamiltosporidium magnivora]|uniref:Uncharacterized protein n=1 Tax=Hamiltosporidium magnivora TaxID=148818 RepID=A0A4Q9LIJ4_9MICR|nr:hypothetical protein CWI36_0196p0010 [Hamiltosporidium magnivora]